jgi:hypothetical protein
LIEEWIGVLTEGDEDQESFLREEMEGFNSYDGFSQFEISILYQCIVGGDIDYTRCIAELHAEIDPDKGPWIMAMNAAAVAVLSVADITRNIAEAWTAAANRFAPERSSHHEQCMTLKAAEELAGLCRKAVDGEMDLYISYYE